ncbi:F-box domain-containing protein [Fusarium falciforme]|uniref:F-box domain-containing protein n=1 Tax=Fusarium falciforme TaxID=195108 RepID=UPI00230175B0|nr:F-box domain-containing protein [Fusarium falciforme]WAO92514.1 F-box domain-containing protein [Fusarium falciforme]
MPSIPHLSALPLELLSHVVSFLPQDALLQTRLVNHHLNSLATRSAFRSIRLVAYGDSSRKFRALADSHLRVHVQDVTVDTWLGPDFKYRMHNVWQLPEDFVDCFPFLSCFRSLERLHLRFHEDCAEFGEGDADESNDDRFEMLLKIFQSLAGNWSKEKERIAGLVGDLADFVFYPEEKLPPTINGPPIQLSSLTIRNLGDRHEPRVTSSEAFKLVVGPALRDLRLHITTETLGEERNTENDSITKYISFENLHTTWLSPDIVANLHTLSLYCQEPWGFSPRMDFRRLGKGRGLPNLKALALGKYTFSHEWQIDWFGSLNLEKLYLDDCAVLHQYDCRPSDMDRGETIIGQDDFGNDISISNEGYYKSINDDDEPNGPREAYVTTPTSLRWHMILSRWRETMTNLRVIKMGCGDWVDQKAFRTFDCPEPETRGEDMFRFGLGLSQERRNQLLYMYRTHEWVDWREWEEERRNYIAHMEQEGEEWDTDEEGFGLWRMEDGLRARDEEALDLFVSTVKERARKIR